MQTIFIRGVVVMIVIGGMGFNSRAAAQTSPLVHQGWARSHVDIGGSVGIAWISDPELEKYTSNLSGLVDVSLDPVWALRGRIERSTFGVPAVRTSNGRPDAMTVTRTSVGMTRSTDESISARFRPYLAGNVGLYHYAFGAGNATHLTRLGGSGGFGFENLIGDGRAAFTGEVLIHAVRGPENSPATDYFFLVATYTFGLKARF
jgi:hypothetical protein